MKPYEKYKESRIPWVDELPVAWEEFRLRYLGALDAGGVDKKLTRANLYISQSTTWMSIEDLCVTFLIVLIT